MTGSNVALDTNSAVAILNGVAAAVAKVQTLSQVYLPVPVIAELRFGALNSGRVSHNLKRVDDLVARSLVLDATADTAAIYATLRMDLKSRGRPIPQNDLWIAAICVQHGVAISTADVHFATISGLAIVHP